MQSPEIFRYNTPETNNRRLIMISTEELKDKLKELQERVDALRRYL